MIAITYIGHATTLIEWDGSTLLTDPNFSSHIFFFKRHVPCHDDLTRLSPPECVLLSHTHFDHLDIPSYKYLSCQIPIIVPKGVAPLIHRILPHPVIELPHHSTWTSPRGLKITALYARHLGGRYSGIRYTGCNSYLIEKEEQAIFFSGDTAYHSHFKKLGQEKTISAALLPIGSYRPRWIMKYRHMDPQEALKACQDLQAQYMIPIHWGTFRFSTEPLEEPIHMLQSLLQEQPITTQVKILSHGAKITLENPFFIPAKDIASAPKLHLAHPAS
ncbi:MAG: hypothetical protein A3I75_03240 [Deltaproteobacteria bacterium RIFCSPLOWO2_02_FULL_50_16]|nr:MAG: hypothetical protein A3B79_05845 [Deltaproteobacteria bacterium RIFCSPHIGHO2_02_FULL_50_15]OGQ57742.1 MAG: hypothetical protein A3I75_03240 [Deltaproteobacteria bacterium RIFCSPLOWO2_02_FULL_50_16]OGQ68797.1 MAG: hypothetical protein A3F89_07440 [Deltaproteobacteria bacterium RIFCSPLOWO2_12_FULL_50_11]